MYALYFCEPCLMPCHLSDVSTIPLSTLSHVHSSFWCMHYTFVSLVSCHVIFLMYALYFCHPCLMSCHLSDVCTRLLSALSPVMSSFWCMHYTFVSLVSCHVIFLMYALYFCQPCLMSHVMSSFWCMHYSFVNLVSCHAIFLMYALFFRQPCLMSWHLSDVYTILLSALSHVMSSFWCMHCTFVSLVSCHVIFLMYAIYFCQPCLMPCHLSDVCTVLLSALSHVMTSFWCMHYTFVSLVSCHVIFLLYALYFCQPCLMSCHLSDVCTILLSA